MEPHQIYIEDIIEICDKVYANSHDLEILKHVAREWAEREKMIRECFPEGIQSDTFQSAIRTQAAISGGTHYLRRFTSKP